MGSNVNINIIYNENYSFCTDVVKEFGGFLTDVVTRDYECLRIITHYYIIKLLLLK